MVFISVITPDISIRHMHRINMIGIIVRFIDEPIGIIN